MKYSYLRSTLYIALFFSIISAFSTVRTVDNKVNAGAQFTSLSAAITAASAGDTILVAGSPTSYGNITINKKLAIIGNGYKIDGSNIWDHITTTGNITFSINVTNPSDSYLAGLKTGNISVSDGTGILVERCQTGQISAGNGTDFEIRNCITGRLFFGSNVTMTAKVNNSIVTASLYSFSETAEVIIDHCLFVNGALEYSVLAHAVITNSIIYLQSTAGAQFTNFQNNMSFAGSTGFATSFGVGGDNSGGSNLEATDPKFTTVSDGDFSFNNDYRLQGSSPAIGADIGNDSEIGIYGGDYPFPIGGTGSLLMAAPPQIPYIYSMNIANPSVVEDGTLNVNIKAAKRD